MKETLQRLFAHMQWADDQIHARCRDAHGEMEVAHLTEALRLYAHIVAAERLWFLRLQKQDWTVQKVWPTMSLEACARLAKENAADFDAYLDGLTEDDFATGIPYTTSKGDSFTTAIGDILIHVATHGVHHRGQIAMTLRRVGIEPPILDYTHWARSVK
jgi:uncharacterized damage-inducible protein DinB